MVATIYAVAMAPDYFLGGDSTAFVQYVSRSLKLPVLSLADSINGVGPLLLEDKGPGAGALTTLPSYAYFFSLDRSQNIISITPTLYPQAILGATSSAAKSLPSSSAGKISVGVDVASLSGRVPVNSLSSLNSNTLNVTWSPAFDEMALNCAGVTTTRLSLLEAISKVLGAKIERKDSKLRLSIDPPVFRSRLERTLEFLPNSKEHFRARSLVRAGALRRLSDEKLVSCFEDPEFFTEVQGAVNEKTKSMILSDYRKMWNSLSDDQRGTLPMLDGKKPIVLHVGFRLQIGFLGLSSDNKRVAF